MDNKEFDDIIKKKLESLNSGNIDSGWDTFRQKWEQSTENPTSEDTEPHTVNNKEEQIDEIFDAKLKHNMRGLRLPFNSAHWILLKAQLESEALFKKRLFVAKTVEVLMLVLIVVGILNVMPIQNEIYHIPVNNVPMVAAIEVDKATAEKFQLESTKNTEKQSVIVNKVIEKIANLDFVSSIQKEDKKTSIKSVKEQNSALKIKKIKPSLNPNLELLFPFLLDIEDNRATIQVDQADYYDPDNSTASILQIDMSKLSIPNRPLGFPEITLGTVKNKSKEKSYVSLAVGPKVNLVNSPFDPVYEIDPYNTLNTNFNISAKIHKEVGPVELFTGLGYSKTSYKPLIIEEIYKNQNQQYKQASLENIGFNTINIPIGVKYNFVDQGGYQLYASAGVDVNLIAQADYEVYDLPASGSRIGPSNGEKPKLNSGKPEINQRALLSQKEFNNGILKGGSLRDNLYATASVGIGLVKNVSNTTSLFIEPKYSHFISSQGLGPNLDKVHAVSVDVGVRYQLN